MNDTPYYFIERLSDSAWLTGSFQWTHDPNQAWKTTEKIAMEKIVKSMFRNRCIVTEHLFIDTPPVRNHWVHKRKRPNISGIWSEDTNDNIGTYKEEQDKADIRLTANMQGFEWEEYPPRPKPTAFEWHNYTTGHCYVDYIERPHMGEKEGYIASPLFKIDNVKYV